MRASSFFSTDRHWGVRNASRLSATRATKSKNRRHSLEQLTSCSSPKSKMDGRNNQNEPSSDIEMRRTKGSENEAAADASVYHSMAEPKTEPANNDMADSYYEQSLFEKMQVQAGEIILTPQCRILYCRRVYSCVFPCRICFFLFWSKYLGAGMLPFHFCHLWIMSSDSNRSAVWSGVCESRNSRMACCKLPALCNRRWRY